MQEKYVLHKMISDLDIPLNYEFRVSEQGKDWNSLPVLKETFYRPIDANRHARKLVKKHRVEVRMNSVGSHQGIYFQPTRSNKVKITF